MEALETSLEGSFQSISIDDAGSSTESSPVNQPVSASQLHPHHPSPPLRYWNQYLDLKTGEVYYVDWQTGRKVKKRIRQTPLFKDEGSCNVQYDFQEEDNLHADHAGEASPSESSDGASSSTPQGHLKDYRTEHDEVLVVAGCRRCLTYFMLPKVADECPKCKDPLLHLDGS